MSIFKVVVCALIALIYALEVVLPFYLEWKERDSALKGGDSSENDSREDIAENDKEGE